MKYNETLIQMLETISKNEKEKIIDVGELRGIGFTSSLIDFAIKNDCIFLTKGIETKRLLLEKNKKVCIKTINELKGRCISKDKYVVDIDINYDNLPVEIQERVVVGYQQKLMLNKNKQEYSSLSIVDFLKKEEQMLRKKAEKLLDSGDYTMYVKILSAYERILELISKYDWKFHYSIYETDNTKQLAIWEQNGEGIVKNHNVWIVSGQIK